MTGTGEGDARTSLRIHPRWLDYDTELLDLGCANSRFARPKLDFRLVPRASRPFGNGSFLDLNLLFSRLFRLGCFLRQSECPQPCGLFRRERPLARILVPHPSIAAGCREVTLEALGRFSLTRWPNGTGGLLGYVFHPGLFLLTMSHRLGWLSTCSRGVRRQ